LKQRPKVFLHDLKPLSDSLLTIDRTTKKRAACRYD
jgi:hypothetical protein